jgi:hypothetical protein
MRARVLTSCGRLWVRPRPGVASLRNIIETTGPENFDVIIDDGSPHTEHQQITFGVLFDHVRVGGVYFVQNLPDNGIGDQTTAYSPRRPPEHSGCLLDAS